MYSRHALQAKSVAEWCGGEQTDEGCIIHTLEGDMLAEYGDWIVRGIKGEFYPVKHDVFELRWEETPEPPTKIM